MSEFLDQLSDFGDLSTSFTLLDVALVFALSTVLNLMVGWVYRFTHRGVSYSQSYAHTLIILGVTVAFIMLIIGSNIARAFTLVGALSIVRFRNALKEPRDIGFLFVSMAIGMACGTRFYGMAVFACLAMSGVIILMTRFNFFAKVVSERILIIRVPLELNPHEAFSQVFHKFLLEFNVISIESVAGGSLQELVYSVVLKNRAQPADFIEELRKVNGNNKVSLVLGQQEIDL